MRPSRNIWPFPRRKSEEVETPTLLLLWDTINRIGLRDLFLRYAGHLLILVIVVVAAWMARSSILDLLPAQIQIETPRQITSTGPPESDLTLPVSPGQNEAAAISRDINFHTYRPDQPRSEVILYEVHSGDTLFGIAAKYGLKPETILWSNDRVLKDNPDLLTIGMKLFILPVDGAYYQWETGASLTAIADRFGVDVFDIISWPGNNLAPDTDPKNPNIVPGTRLVIPGGHRELAQWQVPIIRHGEAMKWASAGPGACLKKISSAVKGTGYFGWPTDSHWICGNNYTSWHHGIDLYVEIGGNIYASDYGVVVFSGESTWGYGNLIVIDHGNDFQTVYAHLSYMYAGCGDNVNKGDIIGLGGTTGNSTGPHLHFEIEVQSTGGYVNPLDYLPQ
jgi:LysM repeat protein